MSMATAGASVMAPAVPADFQTQWNNTLRLLRQLQATQIAPGSVVVTNPNANPTSPTVPVAVTPPNGPSAGLDPLTGQPLPGTPPIILQQGVYPVTDLTVTSGAYFQDVYAEVTWEVSPYSNAIYFQILWGIIGADGTVDVTGSQITSGDSIRIDGLLPNTEYGVQVIASNVLGQAMSTPPNGFYVFETGNDATIPPAISENGAVTVAAGATTVIVEFPPLTPQEAPDVSNGAGMYLVQLTNDPTWTNIVRSVETGAWILSFNDIYPNTTLAANIGIGDAAGTVETFQDLSQVTPGAQFTALIDDEYIIFNAPVGNTATIAQRNSGLAPLTTGPEAHSTGATVTFSTQTTWYARVAAVDASGNQGPWTYSTGMAAGGVTDKMIVGDLSAAHITFGLMQGNRIEVNSLQAGAISTGSITSAQITLNGGSFIAGNPPTTGLIMNSQGLTLYNAGAIAISLNAVTGQGSFTGTVSASTVTGSTISGSTIVGGTIETEAGGATGIIIANDLLTIKGGSGHTRMTLGNQFGDYYFYVWSPDNTIVSELLPQIGAFTSSTLGTGSGAAQALSGSPSVVAYLGGLADAQISVSAQILPPVGGSGTIWLLLDGSLVSLGLVTSTANTSCMARVPLRAFLTAAGHALPGAGNHTFSLAYSVVGTSGQQAFFENISLIVEPT